MHSCGAGYNLINDFWSRLMPNQGLQADFLDVISALALLWDSSLSLDSTSEISAEGDGGRTRGPKGADRGQREANGARLCRQRISKDPCLIYIDLQSLLPTCLSRLSKYEIPQVTLWTADEIHSRMATQCLPCTAPWQPNVHCTVKKIGHLQNDREIIWNDLRVRWNPCRPNLCINSAQNIFFAL